jgi:uncharacterized protein YunC (DUF1805 family)
MDDKYSIGRRNLHRQETFSRDPVFTPMLHLQIRSRFSLVLFMLIAGGSALLAQKPSEPAGTATGNDTARRAVVSAPVPAEFWTGLERHEIQLKQKLLLVKGSRGVVACPYLKLETFARMGEVCAIVPAATIDGMPKSKVTAVTPAAQKLGIEVGMSGREALERIR